MEKRLKYKEGDRLLVKSHEWYDSNKDCYGEITFENPYGLDDFVFTKDDAKWCGKVMTVSYLTTDGYVLVEDDGYIWCDEMFEKLVEPSPCNESVKYGSLTINDTLFEDKVEINLQDYEIKQDGDKWFAIRNTPKYPQSYEECCKVLEDVADQSLSCYACGLLNTFQRLLLCKEAYLVIAAKELGLSHPWEYDMNSGNFTPAIVCENNLVQVVEIRRRNAVFTFPTMEICKLFYKTFKTDIEKCKVLL